MQHDEEVACSTAISYLHLLWSRQSPCLGRWCTLQAWTTSTRRAPLAQSCVQTSCLPHPLRFPAVHMRHGRGKKRRKSQHATKITSIKERAERMQRSAREALLGWLALSAIRSSLIPLPYDTLQYYLYQSLRRRAAYILRGPSGSSAIAPRSGLFSRPCWGTGEAARAYRLDIHCSREKESLFLVLFRSA